jgi:heterodisulfide reductase subunit D
MTMINEEKVKKVQNQLTIDFTDTAFGCFSSRHKFCREICPVFQVTGNEQHTSYGFHANIVAMSQGEATLADVFDDYKHCLRCGACETRCPNTLFTGDFYLNRTRTTDIVAEVRAAAVEAGIEDSAWKKWAEDTIKYKNEMQGDPEKVADWADDFNLPRGGETILFCDCEAAYKRTSVPKAIAKVLQMAGVEFGLMYDQWCCGGPLMEMGYRKEAEMFARHNIDDWKRCGAKRIITLDPHDYLTFKHEYPRYFPEAKEFEIIHITDLVDQLLQEGKLKFTHEVNKTVTYHDPCRLNKRGGIWESPRNILRAVPGLTFIDVDHITQWAYCSGGGGGLKQAKPELTKEISTRRVRAAENIGAEAIVSACVWAERPLTERVQDGTTKIEVYDIMDIVALAVGYDVLEGNI